MLVGLGKISIVNQPPPPTAKFHMIYTTSSVQNNLPHKFSFASYFMAVVVYKIEDYVVKEYEEGNAAVVLIFIRTKEG